MSTFAAAAARLSRLAARLLGWRPDEFWRSTPAELATILAPDADHGPAAISRTDLQHMMERDAHG